MTFSPLTNRTVPHHDKFSSRQGRSVTRVIQHHWAGTSGGDSRLTNPSVEVSANYIIYSDGSIVGQVPEEYRAWTSGNFEADSSSITIEMQNSGGVASSGRNDDPASWPVTPAALNAAVRLLADVARRYQWGAVSAGNYRGHREFVATACPGGYLWARMGSTIAAAHKLLTGTGTPPMVPPTTGKTVWQLADEVLAGLHGNGSARKVSLGGMYDAVQAEVNRRLGSSSPGTPIPVKTTSQLADEVIAGVYGNGAIRKQKLGANYDAVQAEVNRRLGAGVNRPNISQLADAVLRGDYGNGDTRKIKLGANYDAVQAEVNRRLGL